VYSRGSYMKVALPLLQRSQLSLDSRDPDVYIHARSRNGAVCGVVRVEECKKRVWNEIAICV